MTTAFSPQLLNDFERLQSLFTGKEEMRRLDSLSKEEVVRPNPDQLYFSRWKVTWIIVSYPLVLITSLALSVIGTLLQLCCCSSLARQAHVYSNYVHSDASNWATQWYYGKKLITPTENRHMVGTSDIFTQSPVNRKDILSKEIREHLMHDIDAIDFYKDVGRTYASGRHIGPGLCQGMVYWFNALFLKAYKEGCSIKDKANTITEYAGAIAKMYEHGATRQAALLQSLPGVEATLLKLHQSLPLSFTQDELERDERRIVEQIEELEDGIYFLALHTHAMGYIQYGGERLLFNPTSGLFILEDTQDLLGHIKPELHGVEKPIGFVQHLLAPSQEDVNQAAG